MSEHQHGPARWMTREETAAICDRAVAEWHPDGKRLLLLIPDHTRTCPLDLMFELLYERLAERAAAFDVLVALGTHQPMAMDDIYRRVGITASAQRQRYPNVRFFNHAWSDPDQLVEVGRIAAGEIRDLSDGLFEMDVSVTCNRMVREYDALIIVGPVFPHEVAGFSGGNKYLFPGISGPEVLNFFHWLGAVITNPGIIGKKWTPVRNVIDRAAAMVPAERKAFCMVVQGGELAGLYAGAPEEAWSEAADHSARVHVVRKDRTFHTVLSCAPPMYDELWVGAKCMYKLEPVVADGGRLIIYAPHINRVSETHGRVIAEIGYHTRDYFLKQWDRFRRYPWGVLAHSTHVKGIGSYEDGVEKPRIEVVLATGIPEAECRRINLGYMDPASLDPRDFMNREEQGILYVERAGELLYRLNHATPELGGE